MANICERCAHRNVCRYQEPCEEWDKDAERHERDLIRQMIAEKEAAMRQEPPVPEKEREAMEVLRRFGLLEESK